MHAVIGKKVEQTQKFLTDGTRIPVTVLSTPGNPVTAIKTKDNDGYIALQLGFGNKKVANKPEMGQAKKAHLEKAPQFLTEVRLTEKEAETVPNLGDMLLANMVLEPGDIVDVRGKSKGKGFAGGVKRHGFRGGPKTHGQSDRWRAPGSIGSGTTPGRVYRGKRMAGKMGNDMTTLKNLEVVEVGKDFVWVKGVVPGPIGSIVVVTTTGKKKKGFLEVLKAETNKTEEVAAVKEFSVEGGASLEEVEMKVEVPTEEVGEQKKESTELKVEESVKEEAK